MQIRELIESAKKNSGQSLGELAEELGVRQARISEWKKGLYRPDNSELAFFARKARLSVFETLAEIETELNPRFADLWKQAVSEIRQNQG
jgi:transcriptional regulator with XRE-family HTH domain